MRSAWGPIAWGRMQGGDPVRSWVHQAEALPAPCLFLLYPCSLQSSLASCSKDSCAQWRCISRLMLLLALVAQIHMAHASCIKRHVPNARTACKGCHPHACAHRELAVLLAPRLPRNGARGSTPGPEHLQAGHTQPVHWHMPCTLKK